jgi:hypothetical protein
MLHHGLIKRTLAGGLVIAAAGLPSTAQAMPIGGGESAVPVARASSVPWAQQQRLDQLQGNIQEWFAVHGRFPASSALTAPVSTPPVSTPPAATSPRGFQWDDAGIGAAGATVLLSGAALGVGLTHRRRRAAVS